MCLAALLPMQYEWQWPLSGVHSIMMVKSARSGEGGDARPLPFTLSNLTSKVVVYAPAERAYTLPLFLLYPYMYSEDENFIGIMLKVKVMKNDFLINVIVFAHI
jgi:hypothetical protein